MDEFDETERAVEPESIIDLASFYVLRGECPVMHGVVCREFSDCMECWWYAITHGEEV